MVHNLNFEQKHHDGEKGYSLYNIPRVVANQQSLIESCMTAKQRFEIPFLGKSSTWMYRYYNTFGLTVGLPHFSDLLCDLNDIVRDHLQTDEPLWFQSWMNYHLPQEALDWHDHKECLAHGFFAIEPMDSKTVFGNYEVVNKVGQLYIGKPEKQHKVIINQPYHGYRITIAFDIYDQRHIDETMQIHGDDANLGMFPLGLNRSKS